MDGGIKFQACPFWFLDSGVCLVDGVNFRAICPHSNSPARWGVLMSSRNGFFSPDVCFLAALLDNWSIFSQRFAFWFKNFLVCTNFEILNLSILDSIYDLWSEPCIFPPAESERAKTFHAKTFRIEHVNQTIVKFEKKVRTTGVSIPILMKWHFQDPETLQTIWILFRSYWHF